MDEKRDINIVRVRLKAKKTGGLCVAEPTGRLLIRNSKELFRE
jgi:hypothetical protein